MLGKRSRPVQKSNCKFDLMSDNPSDCAQRPTNKSSAFFNHSRLLIGFSPKGGGGSSEGEGGGISPTSPLDVKNFCAITTFWQDNKQGIRSPRPALEALQCGPRGWEKRDSEGVGLGIVAALHNTNNSNSLSPKTSECRVSSANKVKILVGSGNHQYPVKNSSPRRQSQPIPIGSGLAKPPSAASKSQASGMEHSESYTCVTSHGPKLVTRQIYGDDSLDQDATVKEMPRCKPAVFVTASPSSYPDAPMLPGADFLSACYLCRRPLHQGKDIYMYSGDKAFCSVECRYQQIAIDEGKERRKHNSCSSSPHESYYHGKNRFATTLAAA